jgi:hypothetical protein
VPDRFYSVSFVSPTFERFLRAGMGIAMLDGPPMADFREPRGCRLVAPDLSNPPRVIAAALQATMTDTAP